MEKNKKNNIFVKFWNYFTLYEKIWFLVVGIGGVLAFIFTESQGMSLFMKIMSIITLFGGISCELLVSKQSKWCFVVSFFFYDLTQIVVYYLNGYYISALFEVVFWLPMLVISFISWNKQKNQDEEESSLTKVKKINIKKDLVIFITVLAASILTGLLFTYIGGVFEGLSEYWILDAFANTFSVCNGLFLWLRYKEQWIAWYGVCICESILWIISGNWIMLLLQVGYVTNTTYGLLKWNKYIKSHPVEKTVNSIENVNNEI